MKEEKKPLQVYKLCKDFGGLQAVSSVGFEIERRTIVGLIGPNGCGKSTTFNLITGLVQADKGSALVYGNEVIGHKPHSLEEFGLCRTFQHTRLWRPLTVIENLLVAPPNQIGGNPGTAMFFRSLIRKQEKELIEKAYEILDFLEITHMANLRASELSGGQSKLVDIARVLMGDPKLMLLDEPAAGVAPPLAEKIFNKLDELRKTQDVTILMIEHNMSFILREEVDKIYAMDRGSIIDQGDHNHIKNSEKVIHSYFGE